MDRTETTLLIARVRRAFPRHGDVLALCEELERQLVKREPVLNSPVYNELNEVDGLNDKLNIKGGKDKSARRREYMRDYMRVYMRARRGSKVGAS